MSRKVILGVCGSIAAPKAQSLILALGHQDFEVRVVMSYSATQIISPVALSAVLDTAPYVSMWEQQGSAGETHIRWSAWADAMLIAPATASSLAALAHGFYDNCVTLTAANFSPEKLFIAPAMSQTMWDQPAVQENVEKLRAWRVNFLGPKTGVVASGESGQRMLEPRELATKLGELV